MTTDQLKHNIALILSYVPAWGWLALGAVAFCWLITCFANNNHDKTRRGDGDDDD